MFARAKKICCDTIQGPKQKSQANAALKVAQSSTLIFKRLAQSSTSFSFSIVMHINDRLKDEYKQ